MPRFLLDTNILSNLIKPAPSPHLFDWMDQRDDSELFIAALTLAEIQRGVLQAPPGKKRDALGAWLDGPEGPAALFLGRILPFDDQAAPVWARLMAEGKAMGRPRNALDMMIAAIAEAQDCRLVTDNERDFFGLDVLNPMRG